MRIAEILGSLHALRLKKPDIQLRKQNKIKTIHSSLAIEGNTLSLDQITDLINHKVVVGPEKDIKEVKNAIKVYDLLGKFNFQSVAAFKKAHQILMQGLLNDAGRFRTGNVGVFAGNMISHMAPPSTRVPQLMSDLFSYLKEAGGASLLIKACVFHYELEFIHPFSDGNGRMGRLWQQVILMHYHPVFEYLSIEHLIKENQDDYCRILGECDLVGNSTRFVEFVLGVIEKALLGYQDTITFVADTREKRMEAAHEHFKALWFSRLDYMKLHKTISTATASRDLKAAVDDQWLYKKGDKNATRYQFKQDVE